MNSADRLYLLVLAVLTGNIAYAGVDLVVVVLIALLAATHVFEMGLDFILLRRRKRRYDKTPKQDS